MNDAVGRNEIGLLNLSSFNEYCVVSFIMVYSTVTVNRWPINEFTEIPFNGIKSSNKELPSSTLYPRMADNVPKFSGLNRYGNAPTGKASNAASEGANTARCSKSKRVLIITTSTRQNLVDEIALKKMKIKIKKNKSFVSFLTYLVLQAMKTQMFVLLQLQLDRECQVDSTVRLRQGSLPWRQHYRYKMQ